jgi:hypothetical protein
MKNPWRRYWDKIKARRDKWKPVLDAEVKKWSAMSHAQIMSKLTESECYEVEFASKKYQVEVALLENADHYIHVSVSVDDDSLPASFRPVSSSFIRNKDDSSEPPNPGRPQK